MVRKIFLITFFSYLISSYVINAEETYLTPGKLIFSQGGYLESFPGTMTSGKSNSDGYLKIGNDKGIEFAGSILEISTEKTAPFVIGKNFQTNLYSPSPTNVTTYLFSGSYLNKFVLMENKDSKFGFSAYTGSTSAGFLPSMLYIQNKKGEGNYNTVLKNMVYVLKFPTQIRVGIGTSTPRSTLEVSGDLKISGGGLSLPPDTIAASNEQQGNTGGTNSSIYLCPTSINIDSVTFNVIFFVTCKIKTIGGRPNFKIYLTGTLKAGTSITPVESPQVYPGWVGFNSNHPYTALSTYYRDAATIGLSWSTRLEPGTYTAYVVVNGEAYSPNFEVKLSYIKMMSGTAGTFLPSDEQAALPEGSNPSLILTDNNLSGTFFTTNTLVLTPPGYTDEDDATSILQNTSQGLILRSKKGLRNLRVNKVKVYDKATKYDLLVVKTHPQSNSGSYSTPIVSGSSTGPVGFAAYPAYIKKQYDAFNSGATTLENPSLSEDVSANIQYTNGNFHFKNKVNISNAIIANSYGVHISNEPQEPTSTDPMLRIDGNIIVSGNLKAKMGFISSANLRTAQVYSPGITMLINELKLSIPSFGQNSQRVKVMVSAILPFKLYGATYLYTHFAVKITLYLNGIPIGSGYIGQSNHIQHKGFSRLYTLQINGTIDNLESGKEYPIKIECSSVTGTYSGGLGTFNSGGNPTLYLLADEFNKANIVFIGTLL